MRACCSWVLAWAGSSWSFFPIYLLVWSFLWARENTLLGTSFGNKHLYHTHNWWRTAFELSHLLINSSCALFPVNLPLFGKVLLSVYGRIKFSFYFSWVWAPPGLTAQLSSFSSSSSGIAGFSKAQLVSSCCCLAKPYSHKDISTSLWHHLHDFVFSVLLKDMCWRGIVPSHTIVTRDTYFSCTNLSFPLAGWGKREGMARHFGITVSCCPTTPVYENLWGHSLRCRNRSTTNFLFATEVWPGFQVLLVKIVHEMPLLYSLAFTCPDCLNTLLCM